jgi:hypothetical protein
MARYILIGRTFEKSSDSLQEIRNFVESLPLPEQNKLLLLSDRELGQALYWERLFGPGMLIGLGDNYKELQKDWCETLVPYLLQSSSN